MMTHYSWSYQSDGQMKCKSQSFNYKKHFMASNNCHIFGTGISTHFFYLSVSSNQKLIPTSI